MYGRMRKMESKITTIEELRGALEQIESTLGIAHDARISLKNRVSHVLNVADYTRKNPEPTHEGVVGYIGEVYLLKDLEISCEVLTNTDRYERRRDNKGKFVGGCVTIHGEPIY